MPRLLVGLALILSLVLLPMALLDWGMLHDIWWDYASPHVLQDLTPIDPAALPGWTRAEGEWSRVMVSLYARTALVLVNTALLGALFLRLRREQPA